MSKRSKLSASSATLFAAGILLAGPQDLSSEFDLDFTGRKGWSSIERPLDQGDVKYPFCVLDLETTGFHTSRDAIIEVAVLKVDNSYGELSFAEYSALVRPPRSIPAKISALTGITNEMVAEADSIEKVINEVREFVGDSPIVAHNALFDRRMIEAKANLMNVSFANCDWICTMKMAKKAWPHLENHKLSQFAMAFGDQPQTHRAIDDARLTHELYLRTYGELGGDLKLAPLGLPEFEMAEEEKIVQIDVDLSGEVIVFSGFRDDILAARIENAGGIIKSSISRKVTKLLVESVDSQTGKAKKALEYQIEIQSLSEFTEIYYHLV